MNADSRDYSVFVQHLSDTTRRLDLAVEGITCAACMPEIEGGLRTLSGVKEARVNLTNRRLAVTWDEGALEVTRIVDRMAALGYKVHPFDPRVAESLEAQESKELLRCLAVAFFAMMNIMLLSVSVWSGNISDITQETRDFFHWISALIAIPAVAYAGRPFFRSALQGLRTRMLNMDFPISLGVLLAVGMSIVELMRHGHHAYFDSAVMLLFFLLIGRYLDQNMRRRTRVVAANLAALKAETAVKFISPNEVREVPIAAVQAGDLVLCRPGERICVDGVVEEGHSELDQSLITGETLPIAVEKGAHVYAGTLNTTGTLRIRVSASAKGTLLDEVNRLLEDAVQSRSRYVRLADRAARLYAPMVHVTALLTLIGWIMAGLMWQKALMIAVTVLIITCPCALALAIPTVQVVASGALFRANILLNGADAIERLSEVDAICFDKTGTLTLPEPMLTNRAQIPPDIFALAGALALSSKHPLAEALAKASGALEPFKECHEQAGLGVATKLNGETLRLGSIAFCGAHSEAKAALEADSEASLIAFQKGEQRFVFTLRQNLRPDAVAVISSLKRKGYAIEILSGDRFEAVEAAAKALGVDAFHAGLKPGDKISRLDALKAEGKTVLMVGDGLNDAPSLAKAHVSLSPITAVHLTQATADAVFLGHDLAPVAAALAIAKKARLLMQQNLWLAVIYNCIAVPIAIMGYVTPLVAALAMSGSSVLVSLNALRGKNA